MFRLLTVFAVGAVLAEALSPHRHPKNAEPFRAAFPKPTAPAGQDDMCPNGLSGSYFRCRADSSCGQGNFCSEAGFCCVGAAPAGPRRVHVCAAGSTWEGVRPRACQRQADCGKGATCAGFWMDPRMDESMFSLLGDEGGVCCVGEQFGLGGKRP